MDSVLPAGPGAPSSAQARLPRPSASYASPAPGARALNPSAGLVRQRARTEGTTISDRHDDLASLYAAAGSFGDLFVDEDHVQEAVIRYWEHLTYGRSVRSAPAWVRAVARNLARSDGRRRQAEARALARLGHEQPPWPYEPHPIVDVVRGLIARLPPRQREIVVLRYYGDLTVREIASETGCTEGTVKATLHHARRAIGGAFLVDTTTTAMKEKRMRPVHWGITGTHWNEYELETADELFDGRRVAVLRCTVEEPGGFGALVQAFEPGEFRGERVRFSGLLRTDEVTGWAGLWMRVDGPDTGPGRALAFYNNEDRGLTGTTDWTAQDAVLDVDPEATVVLIGAILAGKGALRLSDLEIRVVGNETPVTRQPGKNPPLPRPTNLSFEESH